MKWGTGFLLLMLGCSAAPQPVLQKKGTVRAVAQMKPGGPAGEVEMSVYRVPVDPPRVEAAHARLADDDLVLGVVLDGKPMAYPIRYLALSEVVNDTVGETPIAPTW